MRIDKFSVLCYNVYMEELNFKFYKQKQEKEFYILYDGIGNSDIVSAVPYQGGYLYFLVTFDKSSKPEIYPINNIVDFCLSSDTQVLPFKLKEKKETYITVNNLIDEYIASKFENEKE